MVEVVGNLCQRVTTLNCYCKEYVLVQGELDYQVIQDRRESRQIEEKSLTVK